MFLLFTYSFLLKYEYQSIKSSRGFQVLRHGKGVEKRLNMGEGAPTSLHFFFLSGGAEIENKNQTGV